MLDKHLKGLQIASGISDVNIADYVLSNPLKLDSELLLILANQLAYNKKIKSKNPDWQDLLAPPKVSLEQASSKLTAEFKAQLTLGSKMLDLTGGFGMDSYYFAQNFKEVFYNEINTELQTIVEYNYGLLKQKNITCLNQDSNELLLKWNLADLDLIYIDPARRSSSNKKLVKIEDCQPNLFKIQDQCFMHSSLILSKFSPLLDIKLALNTLKNVKQVLVVSVNNELKELLFLQEKTFNEEPSIHCVELAGSTPFQYTFKFSEEESLHFNLGEISSYAYLPSKNILKAGAFKSVSAKFNLSKVAPNTHIYSSNKLETGFFGRVFSVEHDMPFQRKKVKQLLKHTNYSVITRNFGEKAEVLLKMFNLNESDSDFLCFYKDINNKKRILFLKRIAL